MIAGKPGRLCGDAGAASDTLSGDVGADGKAASPIALVQEAVQQGEPVASVTVTLGAAVQPGHLLVMMASTDTMVTSITSVTGGGATWAQIASVPGLGGSCTGCIRGAMWAGRSTGGTGSVRVDFATAGDDVAVSVTEWSGLAGFDAAVQAGPSTTTQVATGALATTEPGELVLAMGAWDRADVVAGPASGFTALMPSVVPNNSYLASGWLVAAAPGSIGTTWDLTAAPQAWISIVATFKPL